MKEVTITATRAARSTVTVWLYVLFNDLINLKLQECLSRKGVYCHLLFVLSLMA